MHLSSSSIFYTNMSPNSPRQQLTTERVVNLWNSLPSLVVEALSLNCFKTRLDKFWSNQDVVYDFRAPFLGTKEEVILSVTVSFITA